MLVSSAHADEAARVRLAIEPAIAPLMSQYAVPGMAVAVSWHGRAYVFNFGVASKVSGQPVTDATIFEIGSISKTLTATLGAYAEASGKLSLADHPGKYIPELRGKAIDRATLLHFGTYTAGGLPLQFPETVHGQNAMFSYYAGWKPAAPPASIREYSNPSLGLFGLAASNALGMSFASAMETVLFPAFGMTSTYIQVPERAAVNYAWGYRGEQAVRVNPGPMDEQTYGVKTTAADLLRFVQANLDPSTLSGPMKRAVLATQIGRFRAGPMVQGLGWEQYGYPISREWLLGGNAEEVIFDPQPAQKVLAAQDPGPRLFNKTGSTGGFGAYALFVPKEQFGLVMLANKNYPVPARIEAAYAILTALVGERP
ncbi:class C beta-lactamase [Paucibacter sp. Y2R2-4]|uniref:class C beta-lactamase n=1 Tax=Paucibacter sp. Y2R2-4 TaxID=2893553 RepID=UPI0021E408CE|nr:class C beta-lactamase [Paucibacter sp. Y2R2-4]MCV2351601.1 beta-lactamase [Paucibacter sp. Y2R2-4]